MTRPPLAIALLLSFFTVASLDAGPAPANSIVAVDESFDQPTLGEEWRINNGEWKIVDGVLKVRELAEDNHAARACYIGLGYEEIGDYGLLMMADGHRPFG